MLVPKELVAWWVKHHSLRVHVLFNRKNNNNNLSNAAHLLYVWHVNKNIGKRMKPFFRKKYKSPDNGS